METKASAARVSIFISYGRVDNEFSDRLVRRLEAVGMKVWRDLDSDFTDDREQIILAAIQKCDVVLLLLGTRHRYHDPVSKSITELEYEYALQKSKPIISCIAEKRTIIPRQYASHPIADFSDDFEAGFQDTVERVNWFLSRSLEMLRAHFRDKMQPSAEPMRQPPQKLNPAEQNGSHAPDQPHEAASDWSQEQENSNLKVSQANASLFTLLAKLGMDNRPGVSVRPQSTSKGDWLNFPDIVWCKIPAGNYLFHNEDDQDECEEAGTHVFSIKRSFWMAKYPITYAQYKVFIHAGGYTDTAWWTDEGWHWKGDKQQPKYWRDPDSAITNHPVVGVSWYEATAFCRWINRLSMDRPSPQFEIRLPSEQEWEAAARQPDGRLYPWGDHYVSGNANFKEHSSSQPVRSVPAGTSPVGSYFQGTNVSSGVCDMMGNIWEWCQTHWKEEQSRSAAARNQSTERAPRLLKGGAWDSEAEAVTALSRMKGMPARQSNNTGFRLCLACPLDSGAP